MRGDGNLPSGRLFGTCINGTSDPLNCGDCGVACGTTATCSNSACNACPTNQTACSNTCVDTQTDAMNCGMCGKVCDSGTTCTAGTCSAGYYVLSGTPNPMTVFNVIAETYKFPNNLSNSIWQRESNTIVTTDHSAQGYWAFTQATTSYATVPDQDTTSGLHSRMVLVPATDTVVYTAQPSSYSSGIAPPAQIRVATISRSTGHLSAGQPVVFSDGNTIGCTLHSASATQFLCLAPDGVTIRRYSTARDSATLTYVDTVTLSAAVPSGGQCTSICWGGTFAFDGAFFYFAVNQSSSSNPQYLAYTAAGAYNGTYTATGGGAIDGTYFDWSVGRYSTHDGVGARVGGTVYTTSAPASDSDTHNFSAVSTEHTAH